MPRDMQVSDSVIIATDALTIYDQVADPTQMPRWSPENTGATTSASGRPLTEGEVFDGSNKRGRARWSTECVVRVAEPGRRFAFEVRKIGPRKPILRGRIASWEYTFEPIDGGTRVTEIWTDLRTGWPDWAAAIFDKTATGGHLFSAFQRRNIKRTLAAMKADFEGRVRSRSPRVGKWWTWPRRRARSGSAGSGEPQNTLRGRNCTLTRGPAGRDVLGTACSQVRWQEPPITIRSP